ncbi:MAG TPA: thiamine-phosphate kinase [Verrucomicrobiae bacterium]|nr:thiamine-phosphate kinase [Verrucomicrobiae bacterium]
MRERRTGSEDDVLERIRRVFAGPSHKRSSGLRSAARSRFLSLGIGDDAALISGTPGYEIVLTCDWFLEGTHFLRDKHPADAVGWKCLARAVSDIAAMGAAPRCILLSLALPQELTSSWLDDFLAGLRRAAERFGSSLVGGDTTERREVLINVTVVGEVRRGREVRRSGARPGDLIYVSGRLGEAELGLRLLRERKRGLNIRQPRLRRHLYPEPRLELGRWLGEKRVASAMMDVSDGVSSDLRRLCEASKVGALIRFDDLPTVGKPRVGRKRGVDPIQLALHGGDDYELLFTVSKNKARRLPRSIEGVAITPIGEVTREREVMVTDGDGHSRVLNPRGWDPFRG